MQEVTDVKKRKDVRLPNVRAVENVKLDWKTGGQIQQELLEQRFAVCAILFSVFPVRKRL